MRGDEKLDKSIRGAQSWRNSSFDAEVKAAAGDRLKLTIGQSFSGNERNKLFFSRKAEQFVDLSVIAGLDNVADSRVQGILDFDRDGWQDLAVVNANAPLLNIHRNEIGDSSSGAGEVGRFIAIRFVGGSRQAEPSREFGNRDGYGARVRVTAGDFNLIREYHCGEGMAAQNSSTMMIGIGEHDVAGSVEIRWLSGITQQVKDVAAGTLLTVYEDPQSAPEGVAEKREPYVVPSGMKWKRTRPLPFTQAPRVLRLQSSDSPSGDSTARPKVQLYTTMATWCAACKAHLPQIKQLRSQLDAESLGIYGIPVDLEDDVEKLSSYEERFQPAYDLLSELNDDQRTEVEQLITEVLKTDALPSTVVTDDQDNVLLVTAGLPTLSQLKKLMQAE